MIFARHGNTFGPGDKVVWVGREHDLPLVAKGHEQALALAKAFESKGWRPDAVYCASLSRTRSTAHIITEHLGLPQPVVDTRLDELDYGSWGGRGNDEILAADPDAAAQLAAWNERDEWPSAGTWRSDRGSIMADLFDFAGELTRHQMPLVVSSNGILRFLPRLILPAEARPSFKMRTGHCGVIAGSRLLGWDLSPDELAGIG